MRFGVLAPSCVFLAITSAAYADPPPVEVQALEEGEEADFFKPKKPPPEEPSASGGTTVQVIVGGNSQVQTNAQSQDAEVRALEQDMDDARQRIAERRGALSAKPAEVKAEAAAPAAETAPAAGDSRDFWSSWHRAPGVHQGDVLLSVMGGPSATGAFAGLGLELMVDERLALFGNLFIDPLGAGRLKTGGWRGWDFTRAAWARPHLLTAGQGQDGLVHMLEAGAAYHFVPKKRWDPYVGLGLAHLGYYAERGGAEDIGGGLYLRAHAGLRFFWKSAFVGAEVGWYPVEIVRYAVEQGEEGRVAVLEEPGKTFDPNRVVVAMRVGIRF
jgi:hypothetical protein